MVWRCTSQWTIDYVQQYSVSALQALIYNANLWGRAHERVRRFTIGWSEDKRLEWMITYTVSVYKQLTEGETRSSLPNYIQPQASGLPDPSQLRRLLIDSEQ
jgi:hypothetical protein